MNPATGTGTADAEARRRIRNSLDESLIVEASAGTGKTTEMVRRIVQVLASKRAAIETIAAVTFTHKAAGEMKLRLRQELDEERQREPDNERRNNLEDALERLEEAAIGTIHSFCAQILRERPVEAKVDPGFEELSEQEAERLYQRSFRAWMEKQLSEDSPGLRRAFARLAWRESWDDSPALEQLQWAGRKLVEWRDYPRPWRRDPNFARQEEIQTLVRMVRDLADLSSQPRKRNDYLYRSLDPARALTGWIERAGAAGRVDSDTLESLLLKLGRDLGRKSPKGSGEYGGGVGREELVARRQELLRWIAEFRLRADAELAALLRDEMTGLVKEYTGRKMRLGKLDFVDLLSKVRDLLRDQPEVLAHLQSRFTHIFVDEFQDTDPLQVDILERLAGNDPGGKLFLVGDPKQSIYKFRRADLALYGQVRQRLEQKGVGFVSLTRSFRSVPNIQQFVNASFEAEMTGDTERGHARWAPLERDRDPIEDRPGVIVLPVPRPYKSRLAREAVNLCLPDTVAAFVAWLLEGDGKKWKYGPRDIAVLFRRRVQSGLDLTREYARALEARGIPHLLAGSRSFHHREEVETLRSALCAIEWPDDELSVFAALKGSLFAIADEDLLLYRHLHGRLYPLRLAAAAPEFAEIERALALLASLHRGRNHRPFAATINALLEATRAHAAFLLRPGGQQILANVARVADLARTFEMTGGVSFRGFVEELNAHAEKEEAAEAPVLEEDSDGVRLITVHGAKGLEFKVVILADATANLASREPDQYVDTESGLSATRLLRCAPYELLDHAADEAERERAEGIRVAYVAATRARDVLVVPAVGDEPFPAEGWLSPMYKAMYPARSDWRKSRPAPGCPKFGEASVMERPLEYGQQEELSVRPGLIKPSAGSHEVVWWDPFKLKLGEELNQTLWQDRVLKEIVKPGDETSLKEYRVWQEQRAQILARAAVPELDVFLGSEASEPPPGAVAVGIESTGAAGRTVGGRRFGALVHMMLRDCPLDAGAAQVKRFAELNARVLGATVEEVNAACEAVEAALAHPLLDRARRSQRCHREYPLTLRWDDRRLLEAVLDLVFVEDRQWVVVDFKTDAQSPERRMQYQRQLQWYAYALERLSGMRAQAILLGV